MCTRVAKHGVGASGHGATGWGQALIARARICVVRLSVVHSGLVAGCGAGVCGGRFICLPVFQPTPQATQGDGVTGRKRFGIPQGFVPFVLICCGGDGGKAGVFIPHERLTHAFHAAACVAADLTQGTPGAAQGDHLLKQGDAGARTGCGLTRDICRSGGMRRFGEG